MELNFDLIGSKMKTITGYLVRYEYNYYSQNDPRWENKTFFMVSAPSDTIESMKKSPCYRNFKISKIVKKSTSPEVSIKSFEEHIQESPTIKSLYDMIANKHKTHLISNELKEKAMDKYEARIYSLEKENKYLLEANKTLTGLADKCKLATAANELMHAIKNVKVIDAVRAFKTITDASLKDAKEAVEKVIDWPL